MDSKHATLPWPHDFIMMRSFLYKITSNHGTFLQENRLESDLKKNIFKYITTYNNFSSFLLKGPTPGD